MRGRYQCLKGKKTTLKKANEYCILARCPELAVRKPILKRGRLKHILIPAVPELIVDKNYECK